MSEEPRKEIVKILVKSFGFGNMVSVERNESVETSLLKQEGGVVDKLLAIMEREKATALIRFLEKLHASLPSGKKGRK